MLSLNVNARSNKTISNSITVVSVESGITKASYYGNNYYGKRRTANGEVFNMNAMTCAASKKYPFGTLLKVTNTENGKTIIVRVTDRGSFSKTKPYLIDLSYGAWRKIANLGKNGKPKYSQGILPIKVEVVKKKN